MNKLIYLDHAATTPLKKEVLDEMLPFLTMNFGNPSSVYSLGRESKMAVEKAREQVARAIGCETNEIYFTASGTESDNWALRGMAAAGKGKGNHIITTAVEHHAVLHTCRQLEEEGYELTYLQVDKEGMVQVEQLLAAIRPETILLSVMFANNEIGSIQSIEEIGGIAREKGICFHTDAVQAAGSVPIDVKSLKVDLLSLSGHKFYGPKGVGALFIKRGVQIPPIITGGAQEREKRAGTENVAGIVGLGKAISLATENLEEKSRSVQAMRDRAEAYITENISGIKVNGHPEKRLPGNLHVSFENVEAESVIILLDERGIAVSSGSACASGSLNPSHVLTAIGLSPELAKGSLRFTFGEGNSAQDLGDFLENLTQIIDQLRSRLK